MNTKLVGDHVRLPRILKIDVGDLMFGVVGNVALLFLVIGELLFERERTVLFF